MSENMHDDYAGNADTLHSSGILLKTLRNVGVLLAACLVVAFFVGSAQDKMEQGLKDHARAPAEQATEKTSNHTEMVIAANNAGHFLVDADLGQAEVRFLVDTGATMVVLSPSDAKRLGLNPDSLRFSGLFETANGQVRVAPVTLGRVQIGNLVLYDVEAVVNGAPMRVSLLGMSFLKRLQGWQVDGGRLTLAW